MKNAVSAIILLFLLTPCLARTITINADGSGDYPTIQPAIDDANTKIYGSDLRNRAVETALAQHRPHQVAKRIEAQRRSSPAALERS